MTIVERVNVALKTGETQMQLLMSRTGWVMTAFLLLSGQADRNTIAKEIKPDGGKQNRCPRNAQYHH